MDLALEIDSADASAFQVLPQEFCTQIGTKNFVGGMEVTTLLLTLTPVVAPLVTKIVLELIRSRRYIKIKVDGAELTGLSEKSVLELLAQRRTQERGKSG